MPVTCFSRTRTYCCRYAQRSNIYLLPSYGHLGSDGCCCCDRDRMHATVVLRVQRNFISSIPHNPETTLIKKSVRNPMAWVCSERLCKTQNGVLTREARYGSLNGAPAILLSQYLTTRKRIVITKKCKNSNGVGMQRMFM